MEVQSLQEKKIDIDNLIEEFNSWQKYIADQQRTIGQLSQEVQTQQSLLDHSAEREDSLKNDIKDAETKADRIQDILKQRCDKEDENKDFCQKVKALEQKLDEQKKAFLQEIDDLKTTLDDSNLSHKTELACLQEDMKKKAEDEKSSLEQTICEKNQQMELLQSKVQQLEKDKQSDLMKLRLEYDAKLVKAQKQAAKLQQNLHSAGSTSNNDIFRRKLQHLKADSEQKISNLTAQIEELQKKLSSQDSRVNRLSTKTLGTGPPLKKSRRF